jgi:hypothetical protein
VKGHGTKYGRKKEAAIAALLTHKNHEEAAHAIGIDLKTLKSWMRLPEFIEEYRRARGAAVLVLLKLMADPATPSSGRIRAALGVFGIAHEALELDMETRVSALERSTEASKPGYTRGNR